MILSDDQGWADYGFTGHEHVRTPHLDKLAQSSVLYPRGYVTTALCRPSLMTLATGHYAREHHITGNDPSTRLAGRHSPEFIELAKELYSNVDRIETLPRILSNKGYLTHQSGKWWEDSYQRGGFTHGMTRGTPAGKFRHGDDGLVIGREGLQPIYDFIEIAEQEEKPFYLWYAPYLPHTPHNPPEHFFKNYSDLGLDPAIARYYAMIEWFDQTCGELIQHLEDKGLRENTLIYYVCDNGWIQSEGYVEGNKRPFAPLSKLTPNEGGVRTPIMLSWPGVIEPEIRDELVSSIDLMPTVLSAAQAPTPDGLPGIDLLPNARDKKPIKREIVFGDSYAHDIADLDDPEDSLLFLWCIRDRWKLILAYDGETNRYASAYPLDQAIQLYDVLADPEEKTNLASQFPQIVSELKDQIENWYPLSKRSLVSDSTKK